MKKIPLKSILLVIFLIFAVSYIAYDVFTKVRDAVFMQGYSAAVSQIISQAEDAECQPFFVYLGEEQVSLINTECLEFLESE